MMNNFFFFWFVVDFACVRRAVGVLCVIARYCVSLNTILESSSRNQDMKRVGNLNLAVFGENKANKTRLEISRRRTICRETTISLVSQSASA